jgi:hypothetical protein
MLTERTRLLEKERKEKNHQEKYHKHDHRPDVDLEDADED